MPPVTQARIALPDRYRVVGHIANGGMASVWAAEDELLGRLVAVKVLAPGYAADASARRRFEREARAAARVSDHPNVVTIYDVAEHDGQAFIVMEHLSGGTVADRLRRPQPVPRGAAMRWLDGAASALDYAHGCDLIHRDVKPGNLLLDGAGRIAVADFGIARIASDTAMTNTGQVLGTAAYLSPEQALGRPATDASDRYALAVVAYELLTGRKPFTGEVAAAQARQHIEAPMPPAEGVPGAVDGVLRRGMAKEPADRPATATEFVEDLRQALDGEPTAATAVAPARFTRAAPPPPPTPAQPATAERRPSRRPFLVALAAIVFVLAAVIAAIAGGGGGGTTNDAATTPHTTTAGAHAAGGGGSDKAKPKQHKPAATAPAQTQTQPPAQTQAQQPATTDKRALEQQGHSLIAQGNYDAAISVLSQAVKDCPVATTDPCAYALFDLGHALRLAGRPSEAIPVLQQRLQNPDQRDVVQHELELAQAAANGGAEPGKGHGKGKKD
jgi:eukaryotic-like serine/threonine-protein kinase